MPDIFDVSKLRFHCDENAKNIDITKLVDDSGTIGGWTLPFTCYSCNEEQEIRRSDPDKNKE